VPGTIYLALSKLQIKRITSALRDTQATQNATGTGSTIITKKRAIGGKFGKGGKQKLSDIPQVEEIRGILRGTWRQKAAMKGTTIAHNFHLLFGYTFGHIMSDFVLVWG